MTIDRLPDPSPDAPPEPDGVSGDEDPGRHRGARRSRLLDVAALVIILAGLFAARGIVVLLMMAVFVAILSSPLVRVMVDRKIPRVIAVVAVVLAQLGVLMVTGVVIGRSVNSLVAKAPQYQARILERFHEITVFLESYGVDISDQDIVSLFDPGAIVSLSTNLVGGFAGFASDVMLVLLTATFLLMEAPSLHDKLERFLASWLEQVHDDPLKLATMQIQRYLVVKTAVSMTTGILAGLLVWAFELDLVLFWGFTAFLLNYIPTIGSILAAIAPVILALVMVGLGPALVIAAGYLAINTVIGSIIEPRLMGRTLGLSPVVVLLSLFFWGFLFGVVGALLSAPLTMIVKIVCEHIEDWRWFADVLGSPAE